MISVRDDVLYICNIDNYLRSKLIELIGNHDIVATLTDKCIGIGVHEFIKLLNRIKCK